MPIIFEEAALQSVGSETPADRWPCFTLDSVTVLSESTQEPVSLFSGHKNHTVSVVGYLEKIPESQAHLVLDQSCTGTSTRLAVKHITSWSCGRSPSDDSVEIYANGKAGRYLIRTPATLYETFFAQMMETAAMYSFIEAKFRKMRKTVDELSDSYVNNYGRLTFTEYLNSASNNLRRQTAEDVREGFHDYAEYLITMMLAAGEWRSERLDWEASPMMRYFKQKCPEANAKVRSRMNPTGPAKLSFRPNFQGQEPGPVRSRARRPVQDDDDLDTAGPPPPTKEPSTEELSTVRRSTRRGAPRTKTSLVPKHGLSDNFESNDPSSSESERYGPGGLAANLPINEQTMPPPRRRGGTRQQELAADLDPYASAPSEYIPRTPARYEVPTEEPQSPGRLWVCEFRRCGFREYAADTAEGSERIREHLQETHDSTEEIVRDPRDSQQRSAFGHHTRRLAPESIEAREEGSFQPSSSIPHSSSAQPRSATESLAMAPGTASTRRMISRNFATNPAYYLSSARNIPSSTAATVTATAATFGEQRDESGPSSSRRRSPRRLSGNTTQPSSSSFIPLSSNTSNFAASETEPLDDGSNTAPEPTLRSQRRGAMHRY